LRKLLDIIVAAAVVVSAGVGIGLYSFARAPSPPVPSPAEPSSETPSETVAPETISESDDEINSLDNIPGYFGLVALGYSDQTARYLSSVKLDVISNNNTYYHYVQTTPNGTRSETILSLTPNEQFDTTGHEKIPVTLGFDIFAKQVQVDKLDQGYHVVVSYFIPDDNMPADLKEYLNPIQPVHAELPFGLKYASAQETLIYGTGVALESTVITPIESAGTVVSPPRITTAPLEDIGGILERQQTADTVREVQQMIMDRERAVQEAAEAAQRASQTADRRTAEAVDQAIRDQLRQQNLDLNRIADRAVLSSTIIPHTGSLAMTN
jgi:hypothetical protein